GECGALVCYANNDDGPGCTGFSSLAEFVSDGSDTYYIMVEGYSATSTGTFTLSVSAVPAAAPPANDDCADAEALVLGTPLAGDNTNATSAITNPSCDEFGTISDVWYSFDAPATGAVDINAAVGTASVAEMAVYDGCGGTELACSASGDLFVKDLTVGATYYLQVWNDGAASARTEGTFTITASESTLSLEDQAFAGFKYFPNPTQGTLSLRAQDNIQAVSVYNMIGQEVLRATPNTLTDELDMSGLNTGAYFLKVRINDAEQNFRIIKE
ncbi:MAG: T9SS type A sorting domain-containing protein, partial [Flavobacteriaceae bacterium]|nr:T9SS type A sorting domain-containing protein [Flavobacteriaceae bacterium]